MTELSAYESTPEEVANDVRDKKEQIARQVEILCGDGWEQLHNLSTLLATMIKMKQTEANLRADEIHDNGVNP